MEIAAAAIAALTVLGMVGVHELGHFLAARRLGIPIARVVIGVGPGLFSVRRRGTEYRLALLPVVGYVEPALEEYEFAALPARVRIAYLLGGPVANVLAAVAALWWLACLETGLGPLATLTSALAQLGIEGGSVLAALGTVLAHPSHLTGVVGFVVWCSTNSPLSLAGVLGLIAFVNVNLAIVNLLPLSPLDGGRIVLALFTRMWRPIARIEWPATLVGSAVVIGAIGYTLVLDIVQLATRATS